jgi:hypothetical protein
MLIRMLYMTGRGAINGQIRIQKGSAMDMPNKHDWLNIGAIVPLLAVLFTSSFGLFARARAVMSLQAECLWVLATVIMAFLVWLNAAKAQQRIREAKEHERGVTATLDDIKQLLAKPDTTLEDVRRAATGIDDSFSNPPLALWEEAERIKAEKERLK